MGTEVEVKIRNTYQDPAKASHYGFAELENLQDILEQFQQYQFADEEGNTYTAAGGQFVHTPGSLYFEILLEDTRD